MRVLFIYPDFYDNYPSYTGGFYSGLGYLSTVLKNAGHHTELIHLTTPRLDRDELIGRLQERDPHLIAFSSTTNMFPIVKRLAGWIQEDGCDALAICGGVHPTLSAEEALATPGLDMVCLGEGEGSLVELCQRLEEGRDFTDIPGIWVRAGDEVHKNPLRPMIQDLDSLPFPDREIFDYPNLYMEREGTGVFMASRGCTFSCTYCGNKALRESYSGKGRYLRFRSPQNIVSEIKEVVGRYPFIKSISFDDNILFINSDFAEEFASLYPREVGLPFSCNMHPIYCNREMARLLKQAGCWEVKIGLESGNERIRKEVLNRNLSQETMIKAFRNCSDEGIKVHSFNMVGLPGETPGTILETIKLNATVRSDKAQVSIFQPYPGTKLYELCKDEGMISSREVPTDNFLSATLSLEGITTKQLFMFSRYFRQLMHLYRFNYSLPGPVSWLGEKFFDRMLCFKYAPEAFMVVKKIAHVFKRVFPGAKTTAPREGEENP